MSVTRSDFKPDIRLEAFGERPKLSVDCGFQTYVFFFDDCEELRLLLDSATKYRHMPIFAAAAALEYCWKAFGHYEE